MSVERLFRRLEKLEASLSYVPTADDEAVRARLASMSDEELEQYGLQLRMEQAEMEGNEEQATYCRKWLDVDKGELTLRFLALQEQECAQTAIYRNLCLNHVERGRIGISELHEMRQFLDRHEHPF